MQNMFQTGNLFRMTRWRNMIQAIRVSDQGGFHNRPDQLGDMPRKRSERRRNSSTTVKSAIEMITRIVATAESLAKFVHEYPRTSGAEWYVAAHRPIAARNHFVERDKREECTRNHTGQNQRHLHFEKGTNRSCAHVALARVNDLSNPESVAVTVMITNGVPKTACARIIPQ